jgi:hypothetical protein
LHFFVKITGLAVSFDEEHIFASGGDDSVVTMWHFSAAVHDSKVMAGGVGIEPFIQLIEGGRQGQFWRQIKEYFYYAQIKRCVGEKEGEGNTRFDCFFFFF